MSWLDSCKLLNHCLAVSLDLILDTTKKLLFVTLPEMAWDLQSDYSAFYFKMAPDIISWMCRWLFTWIGIRLLSSRLSMGMLENGTIQHLQDLKTINLLCRKYFAYFSEDLKGEKRLTFQEMIQRLLKSKTLVWASMFACFQILSGYWSLCLKVLLLGTGLLILPIRTVFRWHSFGINPVLNPFHFLFVFLYPRSLRLSASGLHKPSQVHKSTYAHCLWGFIRSTSLPGNTSVFC